MNYVNEEYYKSEYLLGKKAVIDTAFDFYARCATLKINQYIGNNLKNEKVPECIKMCCCELAEMIYLHEKTTADTNGKSSESVGGWSVSYESKEQSTANFNNAVCEVIYKWLSGTGLLFLGVR